jgi:hypothetical protein
MFGRETIERAGPIWGLDDEGELRGVYRPSGHPGVRYRFADCWIRLTCTQLWYAGGDFGITRWGSRQLVRILSLL